MPPFHVTPTWLQYAPVTNSSRRFAALSHLIHRSCRREILPVSPATLLGWHGRFTTWKKEITSILLDQALDLAISQVLSA